jgi:hypothetical protein
MSLLSKLLGGKKPTLSDVVELLQGKEQKPAASTPSYTYTAPRPAEPVYEAQLEPTPLGRSWGEAMPNEPNQYNYPGTWQAYFEDIFSKEFAAYRCVRENNPLSSKAVSYTFYEGTQKVLAVELLSEGCDVYRLRRQCERENVPYLRFYYNHAGWWNARSYVVNRMQKAMGL